MTCPKCGHENREGAKFCGDCGGRLELVCGRCGKANRLPAKFCDECGQSLDSTPRPFFPKEPGEVGHPQLQPVRALTEKILALKDRVEGERRQVTVMFCDLEGSTPLTEKLGDEKAFVLIDEIFGILTKQVHRFEGTVQEFRGDGIMALFGAPVALENAAQRGVSAALAIQQEVTLFNERVRERSRESAIRMRIGIHTGPVVLGTIGSDLRLEFQVIGDTVNLAARVESLAEPGTIYVTEEIVKLAEGFFQFESLGKRKVEGKEQPVRVFRVIAPGTSQTRIDLGVERGLTPFIGRERELELLLDGYDRMREGKVQVFFITAEAGVGKSRLLYELRQCLSHQHDLILEGQCLSYRRNQAYFPWVQILKTLLDIQPDDPDEVVRGRVCAALKREGFEEETLLPPLLELLSIKDSGFQQHLLSPEARKEKVSKTLQQILLRRAELQPLVLFIEDLQWMDQSSRDMLPLLMEDIDGLRMLMVFTGRPEFTPPGGLKHFYRQITLNRLSNRESLQIFKQLLGTPDIEKKLSDLILEKTEGIPFFIEEYIRSLKDLKALRQDGSTCSLVQDIQSIALPTTIQDVIMSRVDSLPVASREVLQTGAVIEREFDHALLKQVLDLPEDRLRPLINTLLASDLIYERKMGAKTTYHFQHNLIQEVVYASILSGKKKVLHEAIARVMERLYQENEDQYGVMAEHFIASDNFIQGAHYAELACKKAEKSASFQDVIAQAGKRVFCLEQLSLTGDLEKQWIDARSALGLYFLMINQLVEAKEAVSPVVQPAIDQDYRQRLSQLFTIMGSYHYMVEEEFEAGLAELERALELSIETNDLIALLFSHYLMGLALSWHCQFERSSLYIQKALDVVQALNILWSVSVMKSNLSFYAYNFSGNLEAGFQNSAEAQQLAEASGDSYSKAMAYTCHGVSCFFKGLLPEAERNLRRGIYYSDRINLLTYRALAHQWLGQTLYERGDYRSSQDHHRQAGVLREESRLFPSTVKLNQLAAIRSGFQQGDTQVDLKKLERMVKENKIKLYEGLMARYLGEIIDLLGGPTRARGEDWLQRAVKIHRQYGMYWDLAQDFWSLSRLGGKKGGERQARHYKEEALALFEKCRAEGWVQILKDDL
jgi:class 3 adenylate cyclase/tetratricopeptide (TPR) repeat protein